MIGDPDRKVADLYDMIHPNASDTLTVRSVFVIGPDKKVKLTITYPASTGRNFDEILRVIDCLQLTAKLQGRHAGQLEGRRRRDHRLGRHRRGGQEAVPAGLDDRQALPARARPAEQVSSRRPRSTISADVSLDPGRAHAPCAARSAGRSSVSSIAQTLLSTHPRRQQVLAKRVLGDVGGHTAGLLRPGHPDAAIRRSGLRQLRPRRVQLRRAT